MIYNVKQQNNLKSQLDDKSILANFPVKKHKLTNLDTNPIRCEPSEICLQSKS